MEIIEAKALLIGFIESAIKNNYFGERNYDTNDDVYTAYEIALDKLKQGIPLYTVECKMLKAHIIKFANSCVKSLDEQEATAMQRLAEML